MKLWLRNILILILWQGKSSKLLTLLLEPVSFMLHLLLCIFSSSPECQGQDRVTQPEDHVTATEGQSLTLPCTFESISSGPTLFWYRQEANEAPKYMTKSFSSTFESADGFPKERFNATISGKSVPLKIQKLQLSDSAVYYCALRPTVRGNTRPLYKNLWSKDTIQQGATSSSRWCWTFYTPSVITAAVRRTTVTVAVEHLRVPPGH